MEISVKVCDVCRDPSRKVHTYAIRSDDGRVAEPPPELCAEHGAPLEAFLPKVKKAAAAKRPPAAKKVPARKASSRTLTLEELEAMG